MLAAHSKSLRPKARMLQRCMPAARSIPSLSAITTRHGRQHQVRRLGITSQLSYSGFDNRERQHRSKKAEERGLPDRRGEKYRGITWEIGPESWKYTDVKFWKHHSAFSATKDFAHLRTFDNPTGQRPGRNIEDVERNAVEDLLFSDNVHGTSLPRDSMTSQTQNAYEDEFVIDPITNRKVYKATRASSPLDPLGSSVQQSFDKAGASHLTFDTQSSKGYAQESDDSRIVQDPCLLPSMGELQQYDKVVLDNGESAAAASSNSQNADDLPKYVPVMHNESAAPQSSHEKYADLPKYKAVEIDAASTSDGQKAAYEDLDKYNTIRYNEPDGKPPGYIDHKPPYADLNRYQAVRYNEPDGKPADYSEGPDYSPSELRKYQAVRWNEPDGKPSVLSESASRPEELGSYKAVRHNEPDGKPLASTTLNKPVDTSELRGYKAVRHNEPDGKPPSPDDPVGRPELGSYQAVRHNEPDGKPPASTDSNGQVDSSELRDYKAVRHNEPDGKPSVSAVTDDQSNASELQGYKAVRHNEPDGKPPVVDVTTEQVGSSELGDYEAVRHNEPDGRSTEAEGDIVAKPSDLKQYSAVRHNEPDGKPNAQKDPVAESLKDFKLQPESSMASNVKEQASKLGAPRDNHLMGNNYSKATKGSATSKLTGNYTRDFPEDFAQAWTGPYRISDPAQDKNPASGVRTQPSLDRQKAKSISHEEETNGKAKAPAYVKTHSRKPNDGGLAGTTEEANFVAPRETGANNGTATVTREPTVYRVLCYDPTMQDISMAETTSSVRDESVTELTPAEVLLRLSNPSKFFPHFAPLQAQGFEIVSGTGDVLVFRKVRDATGDSNAFSDTFGSSFPATPASDASVRLSSTINPIDMTGTPHPVEPVTGNFASPTGYVNYNLPTLNADEGRHGTKLSPSPASFQRTQKQDAAFTDEKAARTLRAEKKSGVRRKFVGKRMLVGVAWMGGIAYALGVVGQYFKTGGADGHGPKGL